MPRPSGTVTFLFTDIVGSTALWENSPAAMAAALGDHDRIVGTTVEDHGGHIFATGGDGFAVAFQRAGDALAAALAVQRNLAEHLWPDDASISVRMGLHTGEVLERGGDYFGPSVNRAARLMAAAHGGQVVCSQSTAAVLGSSAPLTPLGNHRLRDLGAAEPVFQVGEGTYPPLQSLEAHPTNLPVQLTSFVGRDQELGAVLKAVEESRLVTLTGVGGVGKTRLAIQAAAQLLGRLRDGAWIVELGALSDPGAVGDVAAASMGVTPSGGQSGTEALVGALVGRDLLLVVDNCEHLLDAVGVLVERILRGAPQVHILATSREALGVPGEQILPVPALGLIDAEGDSPIGNDALRLMVERAMAVRPDFSFTEANRQALVEICRRLDGIPLAIELAAARLRAMTPEELAVRLDQRFRLLTGGSRLAVSRHQTLRATIDWSYDLLDDHARAVLKAVSVFAGGFDLGGAEAVAAEEVVDVLDALTGLADKSLVIADYVARSTRYRMLETVRDYALERLRADQDVDVVRRRQAEHFVRFSHAAGEGLCGRDEPLWLDRVELEMENLRTAVIWAVEAGESSLAINLVAPLTIEVVSTERAVSGLAELCLSLDDVSREPLFPRLAAFCACGRSREARFDEARELLRQAWEAIGPPNSDNAYLRSRVLASEAITAWPMSSLDEVVRLAADRVAAAKEAANDYEMGRALAMQALACYQLNEDGREVASEAVQIARRVGSPTMLSSSLFALGETTVPFDPARAVILFNEAEGYAISGGNHAVRAVINGMRAHLLGLEGDLVTALEKCVEVLEWEWTERGHLVEALTLLRLTAAGLASLGGLDEEAAILYGRWLNSPESQRGWFRWNTPRLDRNGGALASLEERLGARRYAELIRTGERLDDHEVMDLVRRGVSEVQQRETADQKNGSGEG